MARTTLAVCGACASLLVLLVFLRAAPSPRGSARSVDDDTRVARRDDRATRQIASRANRPHVHLVERRRPPPFDSAAADVSAARAPHRAALFTSYAAAEPSCSPARGEATDACIALDGGWTCAQVCLPTAWQRLARSHGVRAACDCAALGCTRYQRTNVTYGVTAHAYGCSFRMPDQANSSPPPPRMPPPAPPPAPPVPPAGPPPPPPAPPACRVAVDGDVRLSAHPEGFVEYRANGRWGAVCGLFFRLGPHAATVVCRQMGYAGADEVATATHDRSTDMGWLAPVARLGAVCRTGDEPSFGACEVVDDARRACERHEYDASVRCIGRQLHARPPVAFCVGDADAAGAGGGGGGGAVFDTAARDAHGAHSHRARVAAMRLAEMNVAERNAELRVARAAAGAGAGGAGRSAEEATAARAEADRLVAEYDGECDGVIRLSAYPRGVLEARAHGAWGSVCGVTLRNGTAGGRIVCRSLGYANGAAQIELVDRSRDAAARRTPVSRAGMLCRGDELDLAGCAEQPHTRDRCRRHTFDALVTCAGERTPPAGWPVHAARPMPAHSSCELAASASQRAREFGTGAPPPNSAHLRETWSALFGAPQPSPPQAPSASPAPPPLPPPRAPPTPPPSPARGDVPAAGALGADAGRRSGADSGASGFASDSDDCAGYARRPGDPPWCAHARVRASLERAAALERAAPTAARRPTPAARVHTAIFYFFIFLFFCAGSRVTASTTTTGSARRPKRSRLTRRPARARCAKRCARPPGHSPDARCGAASRCWRARPVRAAPVAYRPRASPPRVRAGRSQRFLQDAYMFWPAVSDMPTARQAECRQVCLPSGLAKIAAKHGLLYGDTCSRLNCRTPLGGFLKFGILSYRFACNADGPDAVTRLPGTAPAAG